MTPSERMKAYYLYKKGRNPDYVRRYKRAPNGTLPNKPQLYYNLLKYKCKRKGIPFNLDPGDIIPPDVCPILGIPLKRYQGVDGGPSDCSPSIDRIIPSKGYVKGNVLVISYRANRIKNDATWQELQTLANFYPKLELANTPIIAHNNQQ